MKTENDYSRFLDGDREAFARIVDEYYDPLSLYLNTYFRDLNAAEEAAEDVFVKLATKKPRFSAKSSFKTWLYAIGRNVALDKLRAMSRHEESPIDEACDVPSDHEIENEYLKTERNVSLHKAMKRLKSEYRQSLWLMYFESLSVNEIALVMKKSVSAVDHLLRRGREELKKELEKEGITL